MGIPRFGGPKVAFYKVAFLIDAFNARGATFFATRCAFTSGARLRGAIAGLHAHNAAV